MTRKRSRASVPCQRSSHVATSKTSWIAAAVVLLGSLVIEMDPLLVNAFTPVSKTAVSTTASDLIAQTSSSETSNAKMRNIAPTEKKKRRGEWARSVTMVDEEISTSAIKSIKVVSSNTILNSRRQSLIETAPHTDTTSQVLSDLQFLNDQIQNLQQTSEPTQLSTKKRNRLIRPKKHSGATRTMRVTTKTSTKRLPRIMDDQTPNKSDNHFLSRDEERQLTHNVRSLRRAVRIRDALVEEKEEWSTYHPAAYEDDFPTELQWAEACGLQVMDLRRVMAEGQEARSTLVSANVGLVTSIAKRHFYALKQATEATGGVGTILTLQDMIQEGNLGLMTAAERFEPERGFRFGTYATYWIRQRILRSISDSSRVIRLPAHVHSQLQKVNRARKEVAKDIGRTPSDPELAHYMKISVDELRKIVRKAQTVVSLESPVRKGTSHKAEMDQRTIGDFIASDSPTPEEDAQRVGLQNEIRAVMEELSERERNVLNLRYGLENGSSMSLSQTASKIGISLDQVRLVEARALNKLRCPQRNYRLK
ncbi:MAG: hypothetical protein SGILL_002145, partial [Bacillariaceae sp.]